METEIACIGGPSTIVEVDESKFGKRKYHRGKHVEGNWVFGGVERNNKQKLFMVVVEDRSHETLLPIIQSKIFPGTIKFSDCWKSYNRLSEMEYTHMTVNHSVNFKDPKTGTLRNSIEGTWTLAKRNLTGSWNLQRSF